MKKENYDEIWEFYKEFCVFSYQTDTAKSDCATDFLGWLTRKIIN